MVRGTIHDLGSYQCNVPFSFYWDKIKQLQCMTTKFILYLIKRHVWPNSICSLYNVCIINVWYYISLSTVSRIPSTYSFVSFLSSSIRSTGLGITHPSLTNNVAFILTECVHYGTHFQSSSPMLTIKNKLKSIFWKNFIDNFNFTNSHKFHYLCPCSSCIHNSFTNFNHL